MQGKLFQMNSPLSSCPCTVSDLLFLCRHSCATFLSAAPNAAYLGFDLGNSAAAETPADIKTGNHSYAEICFTAIRRRFNGKNQRNMHLILGNSCKTVPSYIAAHLGFSPCDLIHIDGGHYSDVPILDMTNMAQLGKFAGSNLLHAEQFSTRNVNIFILVRIIVQSCIELMLLPISIDLLLAEKQIRVADLL